MRRRRVRGLAACLFPPWSARNAATGRLKGLSFPRRGITPPGSVVTRRVRPMSQHATVALSGAQRRRYRQLRHLIIEQTCDSRRRHIDRPAWLRGECDLDRIPAEAPGLIPLLEGVASEWGTPDRGE